MKSVDKLRDYAKVSWDPWSEAREHLGEMLDAIEREHAELMHEATCKAHADGERSAIKQVRSASEDYRRGYEDAMEETADMRDFCERLERAAKNREEIEVFGVAYIPLPLDADGVPVRVGDVMECTAWHGEDSFEVRAMRVDEAGWELSDRLGDRFHPYDTRHHHKQTVEDVLWEFAVACEDAGNAGPEVARLAAEYAARLRLAEED